MKSPDWERGYRDGWDGAKASPVALFDYNKGFAEGDRDRRQGRSKFPRLVAGPPGTKGPK